LVGKIPGAQISTVSGNPGDKVNIVLRGINSFRVVRDRWLCLDGVEIPFENLTTLDLGQVERVEVVQGAASASIYGAQGANGVIQIFSKKGVKGNLSINVSSSVAQNSFINAGDFGKGRQASVFKPMAVVILLQQVQIRTWGIMQAIRLK
jgi:TonB-dependent SusC/RagA subfamily outer membrane receptor